jgi:hypothetical protein
VLAEAAVAAGVGASVTGGGVVGGVVSGGGGTGVVGGGTGVVGGGTGVVGGGTGVVGGRPAGVAGGGLTDGAPGVVGVLSGLGVGVPPGWLTLGPGLAVCGLTRLLSNGGSPPADFPGCCAIPLGLAFCDPPGSAAAAGQSARLHAMNPSFDTLDVPLVPYQQMMTMAPRTPAPIIRFRTECGRCKSSSFCPCWSNDFPPLAIAISQLLSVVACSACENNGSHCWPALRGHDSHAGR